MSSDSFTLHPRLAADTVFIGDLPVCRVLLMNDRRFPWLILVPRRNGKCELFDLAPDDYVLTMNEVRTVSEQFARLTRADKMNVAALGNQVEQLHIHIIARFSKDLAWPNPVWNQNGYESYPQHETEKKVAEIKVALSL